MRALLHPGLLNGTIQIPPSKSHTHRLLLAAALAGDLSCVDLGKTVASEDLKATQLAAANLISFIKNNKEDLLSVKCRGKENLLSENDRREKDGVSPAGNMSATFDCGESASTLRFLLPITMAVNESKGAVTFLRKGRLPFRPLSPLKEEMERHGCTFREEQPDGALTLTGQMTGGDFVIEGGISSQFITGLLFALPLTKEGGTITVTGPLVSRGYVDLTLRVLQDFGICVAEEAGTTPLLFEMADHANGHNENVTEGDRDEQGENMSSVIFTIPGGQKYQAPSTSVAPEGDWSSAAFFYVANALGSNVLIQGVDTDSTQGDRVIAEIAPRLTPGKKASPFTIIGESSTKEHISLDWPMNETAIEVAGIPDLAPILAVLAWGTGKRTCLSSVNRLRIKESDRLLAIQKMLDALDCPYYQSDDNLFIASKRMPGYARFRLKPDSQAAESGIVPTGATEDFEKTGAASTAVFTSDTTPPAIFIDGFGDHRIVMAAAIAATIWDGPVEISDAEAVAKSYPTFFEDFRSLGGYVELVD